MTRHRSPAALLAAVCTAFLCAALPPAAAAQPAAPAGVPAPNRYAATLAPSERFEVSGVLVERHGAARGRPLILIPGLAGGSWVWQDTIRTFASTHPLYVLTLPGFDGRPPAGDAPFAAARAAVEELIASRRLDKPVVVGHSLGGMLGIALAEDKPGLLGGLVSIDGLPVVPGTEDMPPATRPAFADGMRTRLAAQPAAGFAAQQQAYMRTIGVMDMGRADDLARLSARSDPASVARYMADVLALDLRPGLASVTAPVLLVMPYLDLDAQQGGQSESAKADYYRALMEGTPNLVLAPIAPSRHFAMFDQPEALDDALRAFLTRL
jgi:pimeloyl-ACP methyl ester carboxylesterase